MEFGREYVKTPIRRKVEWGVGAAWGGNVLAERIKGRQGKWPKQRKVR